MDTPAIMSAADDEPWLVRHRVSQRRPHRSWRRRVCESFMVAVLGVCAAGGSAAIARPAKGPVVSPARYVRSVCSAIAPFEEDLLSRASALRVPNDRVKGKALLQTFLGAAAKDAATTLARLRAAGRPAVPNGRLIARTIVAAFGRITGSLRRAKAQADTLPTRNRRAFELAATKIGTTVSDSLIGIATSLASLNSPALDKAFTHERACRALE